MSLVYFLPHGKSCQVETAVRFGIMALAEENSLVTRTVSEGPGNNPGLIIASPEVPDALVGYYPDLQSWQSANEGKFWIGMQGSTPPLQLQRQKILGGHPVLLGDQREWLIPPVRRFPAGTVLPSSLILDDSGKIITEGLNKFAEITASADRIFESFQNGDNLDYDECYPIACAALALNYRLSIWEVSALRLLTTDNITAVLGALIDLPTIIAHHREAEKKKACDSSNTNYGWPDS